MTNNGEPTLEPSSRGSASASEGQMPRRTVALLIGAAGLLALSGGFALGRAGGRQELTASQLASATGVRWWTLVVPDRMENETLSLLHVTPEGPVVTGGGASGWSAGEVLHVFILNGFDEERLRYSIVGARNVASGSIPNPTATLKSAVLSEPTGSRIRPGQVVAKKSVSGAITAGDRVHEGETGVAFLFRAAR